MARPAGLLAVMSRTPVLTIEIVRICGIRTVSASLLAQAGISVCEVTTTLDRLEQAYEQRAADLAWIAVRPPFSTLRSEPRFRALCERMGLSPRA